MIATFEQIQHIVLNNPTKELIKLGREMSKKLKLHLHGEGLMEALDQCKYFENDDVYAQRKNYATSNKDLFGRLLQQEDMVFTARGGSAHFSLPESDEEQMHELLDDVRYEMSLRKWIKNFALQAYRGDPMGITFMEVEPTTDNNIPKAYPVYISVNCIYDYLPNGRRLEYVCFQLTAGQARSFGIQDTDLRSLKSDQETNYFRFVDDQKDVIVQRKESTVILTTNITQRNPLPNQWERTPAFIISDLVQYNNPFLFLSPVDMVVELADSFLYDRSVRDLQKKYHGFAKAIEPLLTCPTCQGHKSVNANPCPECSMPGATEGTGYKLRTKVSDVTRFPLEILDKTSFDFKKIFGYVSPDIAGWEMQNTSLEDLEEMIDMTYWGTVRMKKPEPGKGGEAITATESTSNDQPKEARLNTTADWAEKTEMMIANFIGEYWFNSFKSASISYGRDYILRSPEEYKTMYVDLRTKGAPDSALDMAFKKWKQAEFKNNPVQLAIELKKFYVEPFPHINTVNAKAIITDFTDFNCKLYYGEWSNTIPDGKWASPSFTAVKLREELKAYVEAKNIEEPKPEPTL